jgi:hypothetical protein
LLFVLLCFVFEIVLLYSPDWPQTHDLFASGSQVLELTGMYHMPILLKVDVKISYYSKVCKSCPFLLLESHMAMTVQTLKLLTANL